MVKMLTGIGVAGLARVDLEVGPVPSLTPCITRPGAAYKSKGRRVTICPSEPTAVEISRNHSDLAPGESQGQEDTPAEQVKKFRHSMGLSGMWEIGFCNSYC